MASASVSTTSNYQGRMATLTVEETSYSIEDNTSTVTWTLEVKGGSSNYYNAYEVAAYVNGTTVYGPTSKNWDTQTFPAARGTRTGTVTITHNADGTASAMPFSIRGSFFNNNPKTVAGTPLPLTTIPRATTPSCSGGTLGTNITITTTPASNSFTHTIKIWNGSTLKQTISNVGSSTTWNPSLATYGSEIVSSKVYTLECITYNGSTQIGTKSISVTLSFPSTGYAPTCTVSISAENSNFPSGWPSGNYYVQYKSRVNVTVGFSGQYGATLASRTSTVEGVSNSAANWTSNVLNTSGTHAAVTATVKDNRGRTGSASSGTFTVIPYFTPRINTSTVSRTDTQLSVVYAFEIAPVNYNSANRNAHTFKVEYKKTSASSWTTLINNTSDYSKNNTTATATIEAASSYNIRFTVTDSCGSVTTTAQVGTAFDLMNFNSSGLAMAIGKISEATGSNKLFEVGIPTTFSDNVTVSSGKTISGSLSGNATTATTATKLGSSTVGSATKPIYLNAGAPAAGTQLADAAYRGVKTRSSTGDLGWGTNNTYVPDMAMLAYWNGRYNGSSSNLTYCSGGTIANTGQLPTHGSNSNGHWLRFPNINIQICWHTMDLTTSSSTSSIASSGNVYYVDGTWTFPAAFNGNPVVSVTAIDRDTGVFSADINRNDNNPIGPTSCLVTAYGPAKSRKTGVQLIAIGTYS